MTGTAAPAAAAPAAPAAPLTEQQRQDAALAVTAAHTAHLATLTAPPAAAPAAVAPVVATKPAGVPDKFWNAAKGEVDYAAWGTSHATLETEFHKGRQTTPPAAAPAASAATPPDPAAVAAAAAAPAAPAADPRKSAIAAATAELSTNGKLSDASYASLEKVGYDRTMVDTYIAGQQANHQAQVVPLQKAAFEAVGGTREAYDAMVQWAATNLNETEIAAYDAQVNSKNEAVIKAATSALAVKYRASVPVEGVRVGGQPPAAPSGVFNSKHEMVAAMNAMAPNGRRLYETDAAYRAGVENKIAASRAAGIDIFR